jgi:group II intron reverse transcriptase/maturase
VAREKKGERFTTLLHHIDAALLRQAYFWLKRDAAPGVDGMTWDAYGEGLEVRLRDLESRIHLGSYRAQPSLRAYIPKPDGRQRPLGIAALEDKVVQRAVVEVLNAIYEQDFVGFSYGFRPGRGQHDALDALAVGIGSKAVNWILDADIRGFFDNISHDWMMRFVEHRVGDRRVLRLIRGWLKAGVVEDGVRQPATKGTPQGAVISPLLANIYLHYAYDLWTTQWRKRHARGAMIVVRYADDTVVGFEHRSDAELFLAQLRIRMAEFALELHPEKTRLIEFGRRAASDRAARGDGKPETFDFLGFTHICSRSRQGGFQLARHTRRDRKQAKLLRDHRGTSTTMAPKRSRTGRVARVGGPGLQCLPRRAHKHARSVGVPASCRRTLATRLAPAQPEGPDDMDDGGQAGGTLAPQAPDIPSLAVSTLPRQTPTVGAVCGNAARTVLCGGRAVMRVPTAIQTKTGPAIWLGNRSSCH